MKILHIILLLVVLVEIQSKEFDPGSFTITDRESPQSHLPSKEVILYLTPSLIESGETSVSSTLPERAIKEDSQKQLTSKENDSLRREQFENTKSGRVIPIQEFNEESLKRVTETSIFEQENQQTENENLLQKFEYQNTLRQQATLHKLSLPGSDQWNQNESKIQRDVWVAYDSDSENSQGESLPEDFKEKWNRVLELNRKQIKASSEQAPQIQKSEDFIQEKPLLQLQDGTKYNEKKSMQIEKSIRERNQGELDTQSALEQAEAIDNSPPILIDQEVTITKHHPVPVFRRVPLPASSSVPMSEPFKVNIPRPDSVPLQFFKRIPLPSGVETIGNEKQISVSLTKRTSSGEDRPFNVHSRVPYRYEIKNEKPEEAHKTEKEIYPTTR